MMETRNYSRSVDHVNWWEPEHWKAKPPRSVSSMSLEGVDPAEIRNGWLTLPDKARFQQKQLQERELKIASLYEAQQARALDRVRHPPSSGASKTTATPEPPLAVNPGKVRQMFQERRTKKGIDKSYPLQPIHNTDRRKQVTNDSSRTNNTLTNGPAKTTIGHGNARTELNGRVTEKKPVVNGTSRVGNVRKTQQKTESIVKGSGDLNHNHETDLNKNFKHPEPETNGFAIAGLDTVDGGENNYLLENETPPPTLAASPPPTEREHGPKRPPRRNTPSKEVQQGKSSPQPVAPPRKTSSENAVSSPNGQPKRPMPHPVSEVKSTKSKPALSGPVASVGGVRGSGPRAVRKTGSAAGSPVGLSASATAQPVGDPCQICGRYFASDRLQRHEEICRKAHAKKRKPFDALKHRVAGTEAEKYLPKLKKQAVSPSAAKVSKPLNSNWRTQHEEFINTVRAARQVQQHIKAGGKLSDLPPPPRSENLDYVQCPHCKRRFNQTAAERHIPKCANFQFNKPKGPAKARR